MGLVSLSGGGEFGFGFAFHEGERSVVGVGGLVAFLSCVEFFVVSGAVRCARGACF